MSPSPADLEGAQASGITLSVAEAWALWYDSQDDKDGLGNYWEDATLAHLVARIKVWVKTESPL